MWWIVVWSKVWRVGTRVVHTQNSWLWETETLQPNIWPVFVSREFWTSVLSGFAEMVQDQMLQPVNLIEHWTGKHLHNVILFWFHMWWIVVWSRAWRVGTRIVHTRNSWLCDTARSVPFDDPGYLCLPGWEYFSHFNRELEHVFERCFGQFSFQESSAQVS